MIGHVNDHFQNLLADDFCILSLYASLWSSLDEAFGCFLGPHDLAPAQIRAHKYEAVPVYPVDRPSIINTDISLLHFGCKAAATAQSTGDDFNQEL